MSTPETPNCVTIVKPFIEAMRQEGMPAMHMLGGIGSAALCDTATVILSDERRIVAPDGFVLPPLREDGNLRDVDILVMSDRATDADEVYQAATTTIGTGLDVRRPFLFHSLSQLEQQARLPFGRSALKTFLSDRFISVGSDGTILKARKALFPFSVEMSPESLATWQVVVDDVSIPVPHPAVTVINYLTRSISGLRWKDADKVQKMAAAIFDKQPEAVDWIVDGPGKEQFELARILHTLRQPAEAPQTLVVGERLKVEPIAGNLREHPAFMLSHALGATQMAALGLARAKSHALGTAESNATIVRLFQKHAEQHAGKIVNNT